LPSIKKEYEKVEDTFAEAFAGLYVRLLITAERGLKQNDRNSPEIEFDELRFAAYRCTATPSAVVGRTEGGIEKWLTKRQTPDGREGVIVQLWGKYNENEDIQKQVAKFYKEMSIRIRQDVLSVSTTRAFGVPYPLAQPSESNLVIDTEDRVGKCGGGYEWFSNEGGRETINVPLMMGYDFKIDRQLRCAVGVSGGNLWLLCDSIETGRKAGRRVVDAMKQVDGVITPFYVCPSGSSTEDYPPIGPPTNYLYCPTLQERLGDRTKVPAGVKSIPEIVVNGVSLDVVKNAMKVGMESVLDLGGVIMISAGNYGGTLGKYKIHLRELLTHS
jgi:formylmethanofuran--tetrahydromethanopterin N-formyltransferase